MRGPNEKKGYKRSQPHKYRDQKTIEADRLRNQQQASKALSDWKRVTV